MMFNWLFSPLNRFIDSLRPKIFLDQKDHEKHVDRLTEDLIIESNETNQRTGMRLFCRLPGDAANAIVGSRIDPYYREFNNKELRYWIQTHLFFNEDGKIILLHDFGNVIWKHDSFQLNGKESK